MLTKIASRDDQPGTLTAAPASLTCSKPATTSWQPTTLERSRAEGG